MTLRFTGAGVRAAGMFVETSVWPMAGMPLNATATEAKQANLMMVFFMIPVQLFRLDRLTRLIFRQKVSEITICPKLTVR